MLKGKKILVAITGSIAAYKSVFLVRLLIKNGAEVKVLLTPAAKDFVSTLTLSTLSKNIVLVDLFEEQSWANHVMLGRWADIMLVAPLSCNTLAKMANGFCDNLVLATYLSATCPVIVAPAMDEDMWHHPATKNNLQKIISFGNKIIPVDNGELASGLIGDGRMAEPEMIVEYVTSFFSSANDLKDKQVLITAGPTYEAIDPVRFIGNHSSGKMGIALAQEMANRGATVQLVLGPTSQKINHPLVQVQHVRTADEMYKACINIFSKVDIAVMSAAVADYTPATISDIKIKKESDELNMTLVKTKDILKSLGAIKTTKQILVGFALETTNEHKYAMEKLQSKNADMIVLNSLNDEGAGFGVDTNKITIFEKTGQQIAFETKPKQLVAKDIVDRIVKMQYA